MSCFYTKSLYILFGSNLMAILLTLSCLPFLFYSQSYSVGDAVEVKINELEMTGHFLGQHKRITLCEADVSLVDDDS